MTLAGDSKELFPFLQEMSLFFFSLKLGFRRAAFQSVWLPFWTSFKTAL